MHEVLMWRYAIGDVNRTMRINACRLYAYRRVYGGTNAGQANGLIFTNNTRPTEVAFPFH